MNLAPIPQGTEFSRQDKPAPTPTSGKRGKRKKDKSKEKENVKEPEVVTCTFAGNVYSGILRQDQLGCRFLEGSAKYTWKNGVLYEGPFVESKITGRGRFTWPDGSSYEGSLENGKRHGEGVYTAADGVTRYDGQWVQGHRHGQGRLMYDTSGESYYFGQWEDGWKHGFGRQVWPSGNIYEGQWQFGKMAGQGSMSWFEMGVHEEYTGNWEDDHPQGVGTHTWHAPEPKPDQTIKDGPSQQMNNRYQGQWDNGVRHGEGTFYYANGAKYCGSWDVNVKSGEGRYTFEDGKVYAGPFKNDQMVDYSIPDALKRSALNIGAEDNPVRQCIDVSDLELFAFPPDVGAPDHNEGSGYDETEEVMREVHNTLLRYLGELKQVYHQYRLLLRRPGEDPFVLSMHQLWILARDFDLLTPSCTLSRLCRCILSGPRHHHEAASEDMEELRPLTPRQPDQHHAHGKLHRHSSQVPGLNAAGEAQHSASVGQLSGRESLASHRNSMFAQDSESSSVTSGSSGPASPDVNVAEEAAAKDSPSELFPPPAQLPRESKASLFMGLGSALLLHNVHTPLYTKFWRKEDAQDLVNLHNPWSLMMFRHFLECFVRVSVARYPHEKGLEQYTRRLFKETLVPKFGKKPSSEWVFAFLLNEDIRAVLKEFESPLWGLFKENAVGEGAYGPPAWVSITTDPPDASRGVSIADANGPDRRRISGAGADQSETMRGSHRMSAGPGVQQDGIGFEGRKSDKPGARASTLMKEGSPEPGAVASQTEGDQVSESRSKRRGYGGQQRRLHVKARLDVTIRVKDMLNLLYGAGFLRPPKPTDILPPYATDIHSSMFPGADLDDMGMTRSTDMAVMHDLGGLKNALYVPGMTGGSEAFDVGGSGEQAPAPEPATLAGNQATSKLNSAAAGGEDVKGSATPLDKTRNPNGGKPDVTRQLTSKGTQSSNLSKPEDRESFIIDKARSSTLERLAMDSRTSVEGRELVRQNSGDATSAAEDEAAAPAPPPEAPTTEVLSCDFTLTVLEALHLAGEVLTPSSLTNLCWALPGEEAPKTERVALLDYVETEMTYPEFTRLLLRVAECKTQQLDPAVAERLPTHRRLEGFLRHVFMPSLERPYVPPESSSSSADDTALGTGEAEAAAAGSVDTLEQRKNSVDGSGAGPEADAEGDGEELEAKPIPRPPFNFWNGFDDASLEAEEAVAPRIWPERFEEEIAAW